MVYITGNPSDRQVNRLYSAKGRKSIAEGARDLDMAVGKDTSETNDEVQDSCFPVQSRRDGIGESELLCGRDMRES